MSQHNISGSEVFGPKPGVMVRSVRTSGLRRQRAARTWAAFIAGAIVAVAGGAIAMAAVFGPTLFGSPDRLRSCLRRARPGLPLDITAGR